VVGVETFINNFMKNNLALIALMGLSPYVSAQSPDSISEKDFLSDMPIVLSVSRLPQRLDETPGAVTILDRDMIRLSGARDVADLLRLVPGFQTGYSFEKVAPTASYHGAFGTYSNRLQVLVDGRSTYSPYFIGSVEPGLQTVALADIERIEVLRGSNSAAYGARAMLGVINIVTRHTVDTLGLQASQTSGDNKVNDSQARIGWATPDASFRITVDRRADEGLTGSNGHNQIDRANFRADWRTAANDDVQLRAGISTIYAGKGAPDKPGEALRDTSFDARYVQLDWRRSLGEDADLAFNFSHSQESYKDAFPYSLKEIKNYFAPSSEYAAYLKNEVEKIYGPVTDTTFQYIYAEYLKKELGSITDVELAAKKMQAASLPDSFDLNAGGRSSNDSVSLQHTFRQGSTLRVVWGGEFRREQVTSPNLYNTGTALVNDFTRLFANVEWRLAPALVLNAGAMAENSTVSGDSFAPRVMLNWHALLGQTLRAGVSKAYRPPSTFEQSSNVQFSSNGQLLRIAALSQGNLQPESVRVRELGYLGDFPKWGVNLDVRIFHEQMGGYINSDNTYLPGDTSLVPTEVLHYYNAKNFAIRGAEYQLKWQPWQGAQFMLNQAHIHIGDNERKTGQAVAAPALASTLSYFQKLPGGLDFSLMHQHSGTHRLSGGTTKVVNIKRTDVRLGWPLRFGANRGEIAVVAQNLGSPYADFASDFTFQRRAFVTLRIEN
jgi:iron complex outermembrane receptor protein